MNLRIYKNDDTKEQLDAKVINLEVFTNNESAYKCYESVGFEKVHVDKNVYQFYNEN